MKFDVRLEVNMGKIDSNKALKRAQKKAHNQHLEMVKSHILDYASAHPVYRLNELWEQRRISPLSLMSLEELTTFLDSHGFDIKETRDYIISKRSS